MCMKTWQVFLFFFLFYNKICFEMIFFFINLICFLNDYFFKTCGNAGCIYCKDYIWKKFPIWTHWICPNLRWNLVELMKKRKTEIKKHKIQKEKNSLLAKEKETWLQTKTIKWIKVEEDFMIKFCCNEKQLFFCFWLLICINIWLNWNVQADALFQK